MCVRAAAFNTGPLTRQRQMTNSCSSMHILTSCITFSYCIHSLYTVRCILLPNTATISTLMTQTNKLCCALINRNREPHWKMTEWVLCFTDWEYFHISWNHKIQNDEQNYFQGLGWVTRHIKIAFCLSRQFPHIGRFLTQFMFPYWWCCFVLTHHCNQN